MKRAEVKSPGRRAGESDAWYAAAERERRWRLCGGVLSRALRLGFLLFAVFVVDVDRERGEGSAASGALKFIFAESMAARRGLPLRALTFGFVSKRSCFASTAVKGVKSGLVEKLARMSLAIKSKIDIVGRPRISSIDLSMLRWG